MFQYTCIQLRCKSRLLKQPSLPVCIPVIKLRQSQYRDLLVRCDGSKCSWRASTGSPIHPIHTICILYVGLGCNTSIILCTSLSSQPAASRMVLPEPSIFTSGHLGRSRNQPLETNKFIFLTLSEKKQVCLDARAYFRSLLVDRTGLINCDTQGLTW